MSTKAWALAPVLFLETPNKRGAPIRAVLLLEYDTQMLADIFPQPLRLRFNGYK
jgi:hypothetical protein